MQIRNRLSLYFTGISSLLLLAVLTCIYLLFADHEATDFYRELKERAEVAAGVYLEADEITPQALEKIRSRFIVSLPQEIIRFYDSDNRPAFIADSGYNWEPAIINRTRKNGYLQYAEGQRQVVGIRYDDNQGRFVILASAENVYGRERRLHLVKIMLSLFVAQLLIQFLAGRLFAQRVLLPVQQVNRQVQKITATDLHLRVEEGSGRDEIGQLAKNFNQLLERLEHAFDLQRMFVANASHELKTPLTSIVGELEVAVSKERSAAAYRQTLQSVLGEAGRLQAIIGDLLLLAHAENNFSKQQRNLVRMDELLWDLQEQCRRDGNLMLELQLDALPQNEDLLCIRANENLLRLALNNIVRNGFKFSGGKPVTVQLHVDESKLHLAITDQGMGIAPDALPHIFQPFYRGPNSERHEGHGLGLYIAQKVISFYNGSITVQQQEGVGCTFNVIFSQKGPF